MKTKYILPLILVIAAACGGSNEDNKDLEAKKAALEKARMELQEAKATIAKLEKEISEVDPEFARQNSK
ncbi:MAG: efflux RND transporter periplasmic adaptor subunit, partial [Cyclobacteriaceae bacterium]